MRDGRVALPGSLKGYMREFVQPLRPFPPTFMLVLCVLLRATKGSILWSLRGIVALPHPDSLVAMVSAAMDGVVFKT